ncbi:hypothetical protein [Streptomyces hyaluromycini]|uniref:hypothetical protein n=1 Tax=Streptomyces hyaluromycini TaxID=1377993 RepID=UPI00142D40FA|nr:hypothetical protein [Streptomyces hyaluromycini]
MLLPRALLTALLLPFAAACGGSAQADSEHDVTLRVGATGWSWPGRLCCSMHCRTTGCAPKALAK